MAKGLVEMTVRGTAWLGLAAMLVALAPQAKAAWPEKPIKFVLPFGAGGVADVTARILADKLSQKLNQRVVVENMPGPGGIAAARAVITAPADGYTMAWLPTAPPSASRRSRVFPSTLSGFCDGFDGGHLRSGLRGKRSIGVQDACRCHQGGERQSWKNEYRDNCRWQHTEPGAELFKSLTGLNIQIVPYKNSPDIVVALLRNDVQLMIDFLRRLPDRLRTKSCASSRVRVRNRRRFFPECRLPTRQASKVTR
mgnify:CR=1 FL=1